MVSKGRHPKSAVASALDAARDAGLTVTPGKSGHTWGKVGCVCDGSFSVWCTPKNADNHAKQIARFVAKHADHKDEE